MSQSKAQGRLNSDVAEINSAQDRNGSITVTIPADAVGDLGIELQPTAGLHE